MNAPEVTIIIPNWNHELVLPRAIQSATRAVAALRAEGIDGRVLVVDDASRDGSRALLRQLESHYYDDGLRVLALRENVGPGAARDRAVAEAGTPYVVFLDADNELAHENLPLFLRAMRETGAAVIFGNVLSYEFLGVEWFNHESFLSRVYRMNHIDMLSLCDAQQIQDSEAFWKVRGIVCEDWEFFLHLAANGRRLVHVPVLFGRYYRYGMSRLQFDLQDDEKIIYRLYNQFPNVRRQAPLNTLHLRYHPELGYL